jgi:hypothetical protein
MNGFDLNKTLDRINRINWIFSRLSGRKPENSIASGEIDILCNLAR